MRDRIDLQKDKRYRVGSVTYEVIACFDNEWETLHDIVRRLLIEDIRADLGQKVAGNITVEV